MKHTYLDNIIEENDGSIIATIFFVPKQKGKIMVGKYEHTGIIYKDKVYETFGGLIAISRDGARRIKELKKEKAVFLETKMYPERLNGAIVLDCGNTCSNFVLKTMGMLARSSDNKSLQPSDVYKMVKKKKNMIANFNNQNSTSTTIGPLTPSPEIIGNHHQSEFLKFIIVDDDIRTATSEQEFEEITLHFREQEILRKHEEAKEKEEFEKQQLEKPKEKWYKQFQKHSKRQNYK